MEQKPLRDGIMGIPWAAGSFRSVGLLLAAIRVGAHRDFDSWSRGLNNPISKMNLECAKNGRNVRKWDKLPES